MTTAQQLANRLREVILNGTWIANTNYKAQLEGLDYRIANTKVSELNTLAILAQHIHYYIHGIIHVFEHNTLEIRDRYSFNFPPINSQEQWEHFLSSFWEDTETLATHIEQLSEEQLHAPFVDKKYGNYLRNIEGMIEHSYYHLGQISLIKKMISINS